VLTKISSPEACAKGLDSERVIEGAAGFVRSIRMSSKAVRTGSALPTLSTEK
jgi:hypothetical protein